MVSRRALLAALPATALATVPAHACENPADRVCRLLDELSQALGEYCDGGFRAIVNPTRQGGGGHWLQSTAVAHGRDAEAAKAAELARLSSEIARHTRAWEALAVACPAADDSSPMFDPVNGMKMWERLNLREEWARRHFMCCPAVSPEAQRLKAAHMRVCLKAGLLDLSHTDGHALLRAMERA